MKTRKLITAGIIGAGLTFAVVAQAREETQVEMKDVPEAAQTTIKEKAGNDQILRIEKETRKGKECYEAIVNKDGKETAIQVDSSGKYLGTHDESRAQGKRRETLILNSVAVLEHGCAPAPKQPCQSSAATRPHPLNSPASAKTL